MTNFHFYFCLNLIIHNLKILLLLLILISNKQSFKNKWISQWILLIGGGVVSLISESQDCLFNRSHKLKCDITAKFFVSPSKNHLVLLARFINKKKKAKRKQKNEYFKILCSGVSHGESLLVVRVICPLPHVHAESAGPLCACHHQYWNSPGAPLRRHGLPQAQQSVKGARIMRGPQWNWVTPINLFTPSTLTSFNVYLFIPSCIKVVTNKSNQRVCYYDYNGQGIEYQVSLSVEWLDFEDFLNCLLKGRSRAHLYFGVYFHRYFTLYICGQFSE